MACKLKMWWLVLSLLMALDLLHGEPQVPCFFIFGDSLFDNGSNNNFISIAKANYRPNGIDFPRGPTGRFCNGRNFADVTAELLGFDDYIPPYVTAKGRDILKGVNYASGAAGIREETGLLAGGRYSFNGQIINYIATVSQVINILRDEDLATNYLSQCIYLVGMGSNDYLDNYFASPVYSTSKKYTPEQYADVLIQEYSQQLMILYNHGARKFILSALGPIGCIPYFLAKNSPDGTLCVKKVNSAVQIFNKRLISLVDNFNNNKADAKFIYVNSYGVFQDLIKNPYYGFKVTNTACCGVGKNKGQSMCLPFIVPCSNRTEFLFWDAYHPSEAGNRILGRRAYNAESPSDAYPIDISHLAQL